MDLVTKQMAKIPSLKSSERSMPADCPCGIHSIAVNPSRSLLATGAENTNDLAVYRLPTLDPVCVGEVGNTQRGNITKSGVAIIWRYMLEGNENC